MMHTPKLSLALDQKHALVRAFRSLTFRDVEIVTKVTDAFWGAWFVHTHDDYDGYMSMMIEPSGECTPPLPSFMVSGKSGQIELALIHGEVCQTLGCFGDLYGLAAELASRLLNTAESRR